MKIEHSAARRTQYFYMLALGVYAIVLYAGAIKADYVWDELMYLGDVSYYEGLRGVTKALTEPFIFAHYYRPLAQLSFTISSEPAIQHGINIILHAINTIFVFLCVRALMPKDVAQSNGGFVAAACGSLIFASHPIAVEAVAWVSGRFDTLMCTFALLTCLKSLGGELKRSRLVQVFIFFTLMMCSKESAIGLPVALPFLLLLKWQLDGVKKNIEWKVNQQTKLLVVMVLAAALYIIIRLVVVRGLFAGDAAVTFRSDSLIDKINVAALTVTEFAYLILNPWRNSAPLHPLSYEMGAGLLLSTILVLTTVLVLLLLAIIKKSTFSLALLAALAMSWPALHLIGIPNRENIISDRYALVPFALLVVALTAVIGCWLLRMREQLPQWSGKVLAYTALTWLVWLIALTAYSFATIPLWRNDEIFWKFAYKQVPHAEQAHKNYIMTLMQQERWKEADDELIKFWDRHPAAFQKMKFDDMCAWMLLRANLDDHDGALQISAMLEDVLAGEKAKTVPVYSQATFYVARGRIAADMGNWEQARSYYEKGIQVFPLNVNNMFLYAHALFMTGSIGEADAVFNQALANSTKDRMNWAVEWRKTWGGLAPQTHLP